MIKDKSSPLLARFAIDRLMGIYIAHPWWVLFILLAISIVAATQLPHVQVRVTSGDLLVRDDPDRQYYERIKQQFGEEQLTLLVLEDERPLEKSKLVVLKRIITALESLPYVARVESLFSVPWLKTVGGYLNKDPYLARLPATPKEEQRIVAAALKNTFVRNVLLSPDGHTMTVAIVLKETEAGATDAQVTEGISRLTDGLRGVYAKHFNIGFPYVRTEIAGKIKQEQLQLFPWAVGALLIALFLLLRQLIDILIPVMTAALSILWTLAVMALVDIPLNVVTSIVPILIIIVGSTEDIHLISEFRQGQRQGLDNRRALELMARKMGRVVLLTFATTFVGFLSVGLSGIQVLWQFGVVASGGLLLNFLITISLIPALLRVAGQLQLDGGGRFYDGGQSRLAEGYWRWLSNNRWPIYGVSALIVGVAALGIPRIQINHNPLDSLGRDSAVRAHFEEVNRRLAGLESLSIVLESGIEDTFLKVRYMDELVKIQKFIAQSGLARSTTSFADYLALLNGAFQELDEPLTPESDDEVNELMIFLDYKHVKDYVTKDFSMARILVRHNVESTAALQAMVDRLNTYLKTRLDPGLRARITGDSVLTLAATRSMINGQLQSIVLLIVIIVLIVATLFTEWRAGVFAALANVLPVVVLFGLMGYLGIPLNIGTTMAAAIAIGIAVDDTLHFMLRYNQELRVTRRQGRAMVATVRSEALPVLATSVALIAGFLVFLRSDFEPIVQFGMLSALVISTALLVDFVLTPLFISSLRLITLWDMLSLHLREQVVAKSLLFKGMKPWEIRRFILSSTLQKLSPNEVVFHRDDPANEMYMVMNGRVEVRFDSDGNAPPLVEPFGPGDVFGDVALLADSPRRTDAVATEPTTLLVINRESIENTIRSHPKITAKLFVNLAQDVSRRLVRLIRQRRMKRGNTPGGRTTQKEET